MADNDRTHQTDSAKPEEGVDPVVPHDPSPVDLPGTERGALAELRGTTRFQGYTVQEKTFSPRKIRQAERLRDAGVQGACPPWTLVAEDGEVRFRFTHFQVAWLGAVQAKEQEVIRKALSWPKGKTLPVWGGMELNLRTILESISECTQGTNVDMLGAAKANEFRNAGLVYAFPDQSPFPGLRLRLLHLRHPWILVVRADAEKFLREAMFLSDEEDLPPEALGEIMRLMMIASIVGVEAGIAEGDEEGDPNINLKEKYGDDVERFRSWFVSNLMPPANLSLGRVPTKREDQREYFEAMYEGRNAVVYDTLAKAHRVIRTVENNTLLRWGRDFVAGADWDRLERSPKEPYKADPAGLRTLKGMPKEELTATLREFLFPNVNLHVAPPDSGGPRERYFRDHYARFNSGILEEWLDIEVAIRDVPAEDLLEKKADYVVGVAENLDSTD